MRYDQQAEPEDLEVGTVHTDHDHYQRKLDPAKVEKIAREWDPKMLKTPRVSRRKDGTLWALDGQHTIAGTMKARGANFKLYCAVFSNLSLKQEAEIFYRQRENERSLSVAERYRARQCAEEKISRELDSIVSMHGLRLAAFRSAKTIAAIAAVEKVHTKYGTLLATLEVLTPWNEDHPGLVFENLILISVGAFLARYSKSPKADTKRLSQILRAVTPQKLVSTIKAQRGLVNGKKGDAHLGVAVLRSMYNKRIDREKQLPA